MRPPTALSIAGSDPSGGAGIQADLKTFMDHRVFGMAVLAALTAQSTQGVTGLMAVPPAFIQQQIATLRADIEADAIKIGMLGDAATIDAVAAALSDYRGPVILDPVMVSTSGHALLQPDAETRLVERLLPRAALITPNRAEAARLGLLEDPAGWVRRHGCPTLVKGGHSGQDPVEDCLYLPDGSLHRIRHPRVHTANSHGTGCTLSSAIAARLARGEGLVAATTGGVLYVHDLLMGAAQAGLGAGSGPLLHGISPARR